MNILVVDDSLVMRMIVEKGLRQAGAARCRITHAANGLDGLSKIEQSEAKGEGFDLILTDIHMPVMDGTELLSEMQRRGLAEGVPVVLITADDAVAGRVPGLHGRELSRLTKPFTMEQMQASLRPLLCEVAHG
jgi:CheY-like chemotaxis protein